MVQCEVCLFGREQTSFLPDRLEHLLNKWDKSILNFWRKKSRVPLWLSFHNLGSCWWAWTNLWFICYNKYELIKTSNCASVISVKRLMVIWNCTQQVALSLDGFCLSYPFYPGCMCVFQFEYSDCPLKWIYRWHGMSQTFYKMWSVWTHG